MKRLLKFSKLQKITILIFAILYFIFVFIGFKNQLSTSPIHIEFNHISWLSLFKNNILQLLKLIIFGTISLCLYDIFSLFINGINLGIGLASIYQNKLFYSFFSGLLPHAVFEIAGILMGASLPIIFWITIMKTLSEKKEKKIKSLFCNLKYQCLNLIVLSFICIFIAAIIEGLFSKF